MPAARATRKPVVKKKPPGILPAEAHWLPDRIAAILKALDEAYPKAECALIHARPGSCW